MLHRVRLLGHSVRKSRSHKRAVTASASIGTRASSLQYTGQSGGGHGVGVGIGGSTSGSVLDNDEVSQGSVSLDEELFGFVKKVYTIYRHVHTSHHITSHMYICM